MHRTGADGIPAITPAEGARPRRSNEEAAMTAEVPMKPWDRLRDVLQRRDGDSLRALLEEMSPAETARSFSRLGQEEWDELLMLLDPPEVAGVIREMPTIQGADLIEALPPGEAATVLGEMPSDRQAVLLSALPEAGAEAILEEMPMERAEEPRQILSHPPETAGRLMIREYVAYSEDLLVKDALEDLHENQERYASYPLQYLYVVDGGGKLVGVLRIRDLIFQPGSRPLREMMVRDPARVPATATLGDLSDFFDRHRLFGAPVVDENERLVGVVAPQAVTAARRKRVVRHFLGVSGIVGGEELRSMPLRHRSGRRLSWLSINIVLNIIAASVIAFYQDTLEAAIALAVFLPIISDMSGCAGNQAVAVSIRELTLGLVRPEEVLRVLGKEAALGAVNGLALGVLLAGAALLWKGNPYLGLVVGLALCLNTLLAVCLGGLLPLLMKRLRADPALVSGPVLTTVTDMFGFFLVLGMGTLLLPRLTG
jgi:magnesium transporter